MKHFHHFSTSAPADHPGQPVHSGPHFDVWEKPPGTFFLIHDDGSRQEFRSVDAAIAAAHAATPAPATQPPPPAPEAVPGGPPIVTIAAPSADQTNA